MATTRLVPSAYYLSDVDEMRTNTDSTIRQAGTLYLKVNGAWKEVSKVYKKVNGAWVEQSELADLFSASIKYIKG